MTEAGAAAPAAEAKVGEVVDLCGDGSILKKIKVLGSGECPKKGEMVKCHYIGRLVAPDNPKRDGKLFDSSRDRDKPFEFQIGGGVIKGWSESVVTMKVGERAIFTIAPEKAYGKEGSPPKIFPNSTLKFDIELLEFGPAPPPDPIDLSVAKDKGVMVIPITMGKYTPLPPDELSAVMIDLKITAEDGTVLVEKTKYQCELDDGTVCRGVCEALYSSGKLLEGGEYEMKLEPGYGPEEATGVVTAVVKLRYFTRFRSKKPKDCKTDESKVAEITALKDKGTVCFKKGQYDRALRRYQAAAEFIEVDPKYSRAPIKAAKVLCLLNAAACQLKLEDFSGARESCDGALVLDGANVKGLYRRGEALLGLGEMEAAKRDLQQCLKLSPKNKAAAAALDKAKKAESKASMWSGAFSGDGGGGGGD